MNHRFPALLAAATICFVFLFDNISADAVTLAENGEARIAIVVSDDASAPTRHAAEELKNFLGQVTGGTFDVVSAPVAGKPSILVGLSAAGISESLGEDEIIIRTVGDDLILAGGEPRGTLYAVYTFLEDQVGCHWWSSTASTIPHRPTLRVEHLDIRYAPPFEYRETNYHDTTDPDFSVRNKLNGHSHRLFIDNGLHNIQPDLARGGRKYAHIRSDKWSGHTFWTLLPPTLYFQQHPEWYSEIDGRRTMELHKSSLCLTNEEARRQLVANAMLAICWNPQATMISVSQVDGLGRCMCANCMKVVEEEGGAYSGLMIRYVNSVADDLASVTHMPIDTFAYHYTRKPPKLARPKDNVIVRYVAAYGATPEDGEVNCGRPLTHASNTPIRDDLIGWSKITKRLYAYEYIVNFTYPLMPHPNLRVLAPNLRFHRDHGVKGFFAEAHPFSPGTEMAELRAWLLAKLMWDPSRDERELIAQFCDGYYGPAGKHVTAYLNLMHDAAEAVDGWSGPQPAYDAAFLGFETLYPAWNHLKQAESAVKDQPEFLRRVRVAQLPVLYTFMMRWNEMRDRARAANVAWPLPESMKEIFQQMMSVAVLNDMNLNMLHDMPMTDAMRALRDEQAR